MCWPPDGKHVPVTVLPGRVDDGVPEEMNVLGTVRVLWVGKSGGLLGLRSEDLKWRIQEATQNKTGNASVAEGVADNSV